MQNEWNNPLWNKPNNKPFAPDVLVELKDGRSCNAFYSGYWYACEEGLGSIHLCKLIKRWRYYTDQEAKERKQGWLKKNVQERRRLAIPKFLEMIQTRFGGEKV